jgi:hypothetical protein
MNWPGSSARRTLIRLAGVTVLLFAGAGAIGWKAGQTSLPPPPAIGKETWSLQATTRDDPAKDLAMLKARHPWTGIIDMTKRPPVTGRGPLVAQQRPSAAPAKPKVPWRLAGIVQRGDESFALIATGNAAQTKIEYRHVGDSLPDGSILVQIMPDSAKTQSESPAAPASSDSPPANPETIVYRLFGKK